MQKNNKTINQPTTITQKNNKQPLKNNNKPHKLAFTLAEIMIVFTLIALITGIILPIAFQSAPDEEAMKFQKANTALMTAIRELVNSNKYHKDGDLAKMPDGSLVTSPKYLCNALSDIINTKSTNCTDTNLGYNSSAAIDLPDILTYDINSIPIYDYIDCLCNNNQTTAEIITEDDVSIYIINPYYHFGSKTNTGAPENDKRIFNLCSDTKRYKTLCLDIDGLNKGEPPFGYALRADGKVIFGSRANAWIERGVQKKDQDDSTISSTSTCPTPDLNITPEVDECRLTVLQNQTPPQIAPTPTPEEPEVPEETHVIYFDLNYDYLSGGNGYMDVEAAHSVRCISEDITGGCGDLAMEVTLDGNKYCVLKYNIGDKSELPVASAVNAVDVATNCTPSESNFCCWTGETGICAYSGFNGYSGCNRTVCDWRAAFLSCGALTYLNKSWRLINKDEFMSIGTQITNLSVGQGYNGLMFCDSSMERESARCTGRTCTGALSNLCSPSRLWSMND